MPASSTRAFGFAARGLGLALLLVVLSAAAAAAAVRTVCPDRLETRRGACRYEVPCSRNAAAPARTSRAIVLIHGINRDADRYFAQVRRLIGRHGDGGARTLLLAPQFLEPEDVVAHRLEPTVPCWSDWSWGGQSVADKFGRSVSSFEVIDGLLRELANRRVFPDLREVVLLGHSAGGQFVNRYAAAGGGEDKVLRPAGIAISYVAAAPSSYLYFTRERRVPGSTDSFAPVAVRLSAPLGLVTYDDYGYGLQHLDRYPYVARVGAEAIAGQYPLRRVTYLVGERDNDPRGRYLARGPAAMLQGENRLDRGIVYQNYLRHTFGPDIEQRHELVIVPGVGHESEGLLASPAGLALLLGER